ncbi:phage portal protein [Pseudonocardia sichuanensis]
MGLGTLLRNLQYSATDTETGATQSWEVLTDGPGLAPTWSQGAYQGGMGIPGAYRAAILLSDLLGGVPWHGYEDGPDGVEQRITPTPLLLEQPAPPDVRMTSFSSWGLDLIWHGNAVGLVAARGVDSEVTAALPIPARMVGVDRVGRNTPSDLPIGSVRYSIGNRWYPASSVIHVKGPCEPGALRGMGVLENHLNGALKHAADLAEQAGSVGTHGVPTMKIKSLNPDLTEPEAEALKAKVIASQRTRSPMVLNPATDIEPLAWNPTETQLLEARKFSLHEIALIFGLDPSWLGAAQSSRVYANIEQEAINLLRYSLGGHLARFEQTLSAHMTPGQRAKANLDAVLRADTLTRYRAHSLGISAGFLAPDEAREYESRPPLTPEQIAQLQALARTATPPESDTGEVTEEGAA